MKKLLLILLIFTTTAGFSQGNYKADIEKVLKAYSETLKVRNADTMTAFIYPKFFDMFPKQDIIDGMKKAFADTNLTMVFGNVNVTSVSPIYEEDKVKYAVVNYTNDIKLILSAGIGTAGVLESMQKTYTDAYGAANVKVDFDKRSVDVRAINAIFAVNNPTYGNRWWLLEKKDDMKTTLSTIIPTKAWEIK